MAKNAKGRKGKLGKNKHRIAAYYNNSRYEVNKLRRIGKHIARYGDDKTARTAARSLVAAMPLHLSRRYPEFAS